MERSNEVPRQELWRYEPLSDYSVPSGLPPRAQGLGEVWKALQGVLRSKKNQDPSGERPRPDAGELSGLVPGFDIEAASRALTEALGEWPDDVSPSGPTRVVVGPPGAQTRQVLETVVQRLGWAVISPPRRQQLEEDSVERLLDALAPGATEPVAIVELERWLLRSERGLRLMRRLLARLRDRSSPLLVGCDSWAWSFLEATLGVGDLATAPLALAALDAPALAAWLGPSLSSNGVICRAIKDPDEVVLRAGSDDESSSTLVKLASAARGNPGLALELWRRGLRWTKELPDTDGSDRADAETTLWVAPASDSEVVLPTGLEPCHGFVLHTTLLHGGLERELVGEVVPLPGYQLLRCVRDLIQQGLLTEREGTLSVPLVAYGPVRRHLDGGGFLVDAF